MATTPLSAILRHMQDVLARNRASKVSDRELLRRFSRERDQKAFTALVQRHGKLVMGICRRLLRNEQDAEDAFQATFMVLARKADVVQWQDSIQSWLHSAAVRVAKKAQGREARRAYHECQAGQLAHAPEEASAAYGRLCDLLDEELLRLPETYRQALILCYLQGHTRDQAAHRLGWSLRTLDRRLERGRNLLRWRLQKRGVGLSVALLVGGIEQCAVGAVSAAVVRQAVVSAAAFAAADAVLVDSAAVALAEIGLQSLTGGSLKLTAALIFIVALLAVGTGWATYKGFAEKVPGAVVEKPQLPEAKRDQTSGKMARPGVDLYGDPLPDGAIGRLGTVRFRQPYMSTVAYGLGGKVLITSASLGLGMCIWDAATGKLLSRPEVPSPYRLFAVSGDGNRLITDRRDVFDIATGKEITCLPAPLDPSSSYRVALSHDGSMAAMAEEKWDRVRFTVTVFDVATWQNRRLAGHTDLVTGLAFSPDNKTLVTCSQDNTLRVWDVETGKQARKIEAKDCWNIAFAPDGKSVACTGGPAYLVRIFDVQTGKLLRELPGTERAGDVVYSPDGKILATSNHWDSVVFWDPETGKEIRRLPAPTRNFSSPDYFDLSLAFSQDGKSFAAATRSAILRWDVATGKEIDPPAGHDGPAGGLRFSEDGRSLFSSSGGGNGGGYTLMEWDLASHREKKRLTVGPFGDSTTNWVGAPDSHTLDNRYVAVIGSFRRGLPGYQPDSKFYLYDAATAKKIKTFVGHPDQVWGSRLSPRGTALLTFAKDGVRLWNVPTGKQVRHWDRNAEPQAFSYAYAFSPDEKWLAWQWGDNRVHLLATADAKEIRSWENEIPERENSWLFFSPDGTLLASLRSNHVFRVWDVASARQVAQFGEPNQSFNYPHAFSPDGRYVVEAQAKPPLQSGFMGPRTTFAISLWEVLSGQKVRTIDMGPFWPIDLAVSPDSRVLGVGGMDSTILLLDITAESKNAKRDVPNRKELDALWVDLGDDATKAYAAIWSFELAPDSSVRYLKDRLKPAAPADQAGKLVADLDSDRFALREKAAKTLEDLGDAAEGALHKRLQAKPSLETQRRLESIIEKLDKSLFQKLRAIAALEYIGNAQAKEVLQSLRTAPNPRVAEAAAVSLQRMASRPVR